MFLDFPLLILDEINRCPAALTNALLGVLEGKIELKLGIKHDVGHKYTDADGLAHRYNLAFGTMNEGEDFEGTFGVDRALRNRLILTIPLDSCRLTAEDLANALYERTGPARIPQMPPMVDDVAFVSERVVSLPMDDLAFLYLLYVANLDHCPHMPGGYKRLPCNAEICMRYECRVLRQAEGFCAYARAVGVRTGISLKRAAKGLTALRAARTLRHVDEACKAGAGSVAPDKLEALQGFSGSQAQGPLLGRAVADRYLSRLCVSVDEILALLPTAIIGKGYLADEYVAKHHGGDIWAAMRSYGSETYAWLEAFFRDNAAIFEELSNGNGGVSGLRERLAHAEKFTDPFIRHVLEPFLDKIDQRRPPEEVSADLERRKAIGSVASLLTQAAGNDAGG